jgi:hypothetical protein
MMHCKKKARADPQLLARPWLRRIATAPDPCHRRVLPPGIALISSLQFMQRAYAKIWVPPQEEACDYIRYDKAKTQNK